MKKHYTDAQKQQIMKEVTETGNLTLVAEKHGFPKSTVASWISRQQPHHIEKHKQNSELKDMKKKVADAELKNKVLTELLKKTYQVWSND